MLVAISGTTGVQIGARFMKILHELKIEFDLIISEMAQKIIQIETNEDIKNLERLANNVYDNNDLTAPPASGSSNKEIMVIIPCSMKSLSAIAHGYSNSLITRAADVMIKEKKKLVIMPRENPLSVIHLKNMLTLAEVGVVIFPPIPSFYYNPQSIEDLIDHMLGRLLDQLEIKTNIRRWDEVYNKSE